MRASVYYGARLYHVRHMAFTPPATLRRMAEYRRQDGRWLQLIPPGGSSTAACAGYVNAALELKEQVAAGLLPEPDNIYVAAGTIGTAAGLLLGLRLAGLRSRLVAVRVTSRWYVNRLTFAGLLRRINQWLNHGDRSVPMIPRPLQSLSLRHQYNSNGYASQTEASREAIQFMADCEGITLEGTYTGKTMAALLADLRQNRAQRDQVNLFWNTYNSQDISAQANAVAVDRLPRSLQHYCNKQCPDLKETASIAKNSDMKEFP
jgi:D-cysteine desulfhydrase